MDGVDQPVPVPVLRVCHHHAPGDDGGDAEAAGGGEHGVAIGARTQLGAEAGGTRELYQSFEEHHVLRDDGEAFAIDGELGRERKVGLPVHRAHGAAQRAPAAGVFGEDHRVLAVGHEVGAENRADAGGLARLLELHGAVDAVGVGQREGAVPSACGGLDQDLRRRDAEAEGEPGVDVQVGEHEGRRS